MQRSELAVLLDMLNRRMEEQDKALNALLQKFIDDKDDKKKKHHDDHLKSLDVKDLKKPDEYDGEEKSFILWYARLKDLLQARDAK